MKVSYEALKQEFKRVLLARNVREDIAEECATMFADTTESGVYSHGVNRFPRFISQLGQNLDSVFWIKFHLAAKKAC